MKDLISSPQNPKIKNVVQLIEKSSERRKQQLIVVEGAREISLANKGNFKIESLFICPEIFKENDLRSHLSVTDHKIYEVSRNVFGKIAFRENSDGIIALMQPVFITLSQIKLSKNPLVIVLEAVEKPGNLGAILRTADAARADAVIVCDPRTDIYNPNSIRSSVGCVFTNQIVTDNAEAVLAWLNSHNITSCAAALTADRLYHETDLSKPLALVMGTEADGLTNFWLENCKAQIKIPMLGHIDSLNVSASTAILVFEAMRQRSFEV